MTQRLHDRGARLRVHCWLRECRSQYSCGCVLFAHHYFVVAAGGPRSRHGMREPTRCDARVGASCPMSCSPRPSGSGHARSGAWLTHRPPSDPRAVNAPAPATERVRPARRARGDGAARGRERGREGAGPVGLSGYAVSARRRG